MQICKLQIPSLHLIKKLTKKVIRKPYGQLQHLYINEKIKSAQAAKNQNQLQFLYDEKKQVLLKLETLNLTVSISANISLRYLRIISKLL